MITLHVGGRLPHFYVIVFQGLQLQASIRNRIRYVFKSFHSGERFQKFGVTVCVFAGYVWTKAGSVTKYLGIQTNPDTCGQQGWKKYFSFWHCGPKTLKFSASFALFQVEYLLICGCIFIGALA